MLILQQNYEKMNEKILRLLLSFNLTYTSSDGVKLVAQSLAPLSLVGNKLTPNAKTLKFIVKYKIKTFKTIIL